MRQRRRSTSDTSGHLLLATFPILLLLALLGMATLLVATEGNRNAGRQRRVDGAFLAAQSGIEYAAAMLRLSPGHSYRGGALPVPINRAIVTIDRPLFIRPGDGVAEDVYLVVATARTGPIVRSVEAEVAVSDVASRIVSWKERPAQRRAWRG